MVCFIEPQLREWRGEYPDPVGEEPMVSKHVVGALNLLSHRQRQRFWSAFKHRGNEKKALNIARSSPR